MHRTLALLLALLVGSPAFAADSFYLSLLREGATAQERGDNEEAAVTLRLACFGLLDDPELLVEGLVRLGLAQGELGDREGFEATFRRLLDAEGRLKIYSQAKMRPDLVERYEEQVVLWIPPGTLVDSEIFSGLAEKGRAQRVRSLAPRERRTELQRLVEEDPESALWPLLLADLEAREGREGEVIRWADEALRRDPENGDAHCYRGWARVEDKSYSEGLGDLEVCPRRESDPFFVAPYLRALSELEEWGKAAAVTDSLSAEVLADPAVGKLVGRVEKERLSDSSSAAAQPVAAEEDSVDSPPGLDATNVDQLAQGRALLQEAQSAEDLGQAWELASRLVRDYPNWPDAQLLAGEVAYRASRWEAAAGHFYRAGDLSGSPHLLFYYAVSLYESGRLEEAKQAALLCQDKIRRTEFVQRYLEKILGDGAGTEN